MEASDAISSMRYKNADKIDEFIHFVMDNSNDGLLAVNIAIWLILNEYDWNALLYDIHCDINDKFVPNQSNLYRFLKQYNEHKLFEQIYTQYLDDIRALHQYDTKQRNAKIDRKCICGTRLVQITVTERIKEYYSDWKIRPKEITCDQCLKTYYKDDIIFYCPKKSAKHPDSYDICNLCALKYKHSPSNRKILLLQSMEYSVDEAIEALRETKEDENAAINYLVRKKQIKIDKEKKINAFYHTHNEHINPLIHSGNIQSKQSNEKDDSKVEHNENDDEETKSSDSTEDSEEQKSVTCDIQSCVDLDSALFALRNMDQVIDITVVVNAFLHLMEFHNDDKDFLFIVNSLNFCDFNQCCVFKRHYRDRNDVFTNEPNVRDQIIDKFHCYYLHSQDLGHRSYANIKKQNDDNNKSVIKQKVQLVLNQKYNARKYVYRHKKKEKFSQIKPNFIAFSTKTPYYSFGVEYQYISAAGDMDDKKNNDEARIKPLFVNAPMFKSLKDELTQNGIARMTMEQFKNEYIKAMILFNSFYRRRIYPHMTMEHLLSLKTYSNYDGLQREFSKTYRRNENESDEDLIERHRNYYFLGKNLKYAVNKFGSVSKYKLYHGISERLVFPAYTGNVVINSPLSTTSCFEVAVNFADKKGMIVQFKSAQSHSNKLSDSSCLSLKLEWLSDFISEREHLYIQSDGIFGIEDVIDIMSAVRYENILKAFDIMDTPFLSSRIDHSMKILIQKIIHHQLSLKLSCYQPFASLDAYARDIINVYCHNKTYCEIRFGNKVFEEFEMFKKKWINMKLIHILFPNIQFIHLRNVNLCKYSMEYIHEYLQQVNTKGSNVKLIWINPKENSDWCIIDIVNEYKQQFETLNFSIKSIKNVGFATDKKYNSCNYLSIENMKSIIKFVKGKVISNKPTFGKYYTLKYDQAKNRTHVSAGNLSKIWCLK